MSAGRALDDDAVAVTRATGHSMEPALRVAGRASAIRLVLAGQAPVPPQWAVPDFVAHVEQVRRQLGPIRSPGALLASYASEARFRTAARDLHPGGAESGADDALDLAYALRLIEIEGGLERVGWTALIRRAAETRFRDRAAV